MKRVGIVGEHYDNDAGALKKLLEQKYNARIALFFPLLKTIKGNHLDRIQKVKGMLIAESKKLKLDLIVYVRDLDSLPSDIDKSTALQRWYQQIQIHHEDLFFLSIFELEALILADITKFNELYEVSISFKGNPLFKENPKEYLKTQTGKAKQKYHESHATKIFEQLRFEELYTNHCHSDHPCFQSFIDELDQKLA